MDEREIQRIIALDHAHVWHPFTPMRQWRQSAPLIIERGEGEWLIDARGNRYIDGVSSLWCNVHGHRVAAIDEAIRAQLDKIAHSTLLGLSSVPAVELAAKLVELAPGGLTKVFYSDAGATATELAFKMAVGYWYHRGEPQRHVLLGLEGAYHGDTAGAMSVGYSEVFHRPFRKLTFRSEFVAPPAPAATGVYSKVLKNFGTSQAGAVKGHGVHRPWPLEVAEACGQAVDESLAAMDTKLRELGRTCAAVVVEPLVQGAAGLVVQPAGYLRGVAELCRKHGVLLIADEVATGCGRTGRLFACEHEGVEPDLMCLGKGLSGGYLPLAATLASDRIAEAFEGQLHDMKTLYHGHTFTGNPLACAAALASIDLFDRNDVLSEVNRKAALLRQWLNPLRDRPQVADVRQCGLMVGIELVGRASPGETPGSPTPGGGALGDFGESPALGGGYLRRVGYEVCDAARADGVIVRPLGNVVILMPPLCIVEANLKRLAEVVTARIAALRD